MRYKVSNESETGHCRFKASVLDTNLEDRGCASQVVCETFSVADGLAIADALNIADAARSDAARSDAPQEKKCKRVWQEFCDLHPHADPSEFWCFYRDDGRYRVYHSDNVFNQPGGRPKGTGVAEFVITEEGQSVQLWSWIKDG